MERVKLSRREKEVLRLVAAGGGCPSGYPRHVYVACLDSLACMGLVSVAWAEGHEPVAARLTDRARSYLAVNPALRNPVDWKWVVPTAIAVAALAVAVAGAVR